MVSREVISKILVAGAQAPSGSNSQPWQFRVRGNVIEVIALPEKDHPVLNFRYRGTWVAHGALIENMLLACRKLGVQANMKIFPKKEEPNVTAILDLQESTSKDEPLYEAMFRRCTNRKRYATVPLPKEQREALMRAGESVGAKNVGIKLIGDPEKIKKLGEAASVNEIVMFENKALHRLLFEEIVWTKEEEERRGKGLYFKTMELGAPMFVLKLLSRWPLMSVLNKLGVAKAIAKSNVKMYAAAPLVCTITTGEAAEDFIAAGRVMEKIWLQATAVGLAVHLMTGALFMWQRIAAGETEWFSKEHIALIQDAYNTTASIVGAGDKNVALLFRIGKAEEPSAKSIKLSPEIS